MEMFSFFERALFSNPKNRENAAVQLCLDEFVKTEKYVNALFWMLFVVTGDKVPYTTAMLLLSKESLAVFHLFEPSIS